jgi:mannitol/fructose-specific phosphotransferase system IIA component (Ntr-type)
VDFDSLDRLPSRIFIVTLSPVTMVGPHTQYLAAISRVLGNASARERLLQARSAAEAIAVIAEHVQDRRTATPPQPPGGAP